MLRRLRILRVRMLGTIRPIPVAVGTTRLLRLDTILRTLRDTRLGIRILLRLDIRTRHLLQQLGLSVHLRALGIATSTILQIRTPA